MKRFLLLVALVLAAAGCAAQTGSAVLLKADRDFAQAVAQKGLEGWMSFMADQAVLLRPQPVVGNDAVRNAMRETFANPNSKLTWTPTRGELFKSGNMGYTVGRFEAVQTGEKGEKFTVRGTYLTVWQKQPDGSWKVVCDGGSPDPAPAKPAAKPKP